MPGSSGHSCMGGLIGIHHDTSNTPSFRTSARLETTEIKMELWVLGPAVSMAAHGYWSGLRCILVRDMQSKRRESRSVHARDCTLRFSACADRNDMSLHLCWSCCNLMACQTMGQSYCQSIHYLLLPSASPFFTIWCSQLAVQLHRRWAC